MAMNKREQAERATLLKALAMSRAMAYPTFEKPVPMSAPEDWDTVIHGWQYNSYSMTIREMWSSKSTNWTSEPDRTKRFNGGSHGFCTMYATPQDAYRAMIIEKWHEDARQMATAYEMAGIDLEAHYV